MLTLAPLNEHSVTPRQTWSPRDKSVSPSPAVYPPPGRHGTLEMVVYEISAQSHPVPPALHPVSPVHPPVSPGHQPMSPVHPPVSPVHQPVSPYHHGGRGPLEMNALPLAPLYHQSITPYHQSITPWRSWPLPALSWIEAMFGGDKTSTDFRRGSEVIGYE